MDNPGYVVQISDASAEVYAAQAREDAREAREQALRESEEHMARLRRES